MKSGITFVQLAHNIKKIRYPFPMSFLSALPVAEKFIFVVAGPHDDDTEWAVYDIASQYPNVVIILRGGTESTGFDVDSGYDVYQFPDIAWPTHKDGLAQLVQAGFDCAETEVVVQLQADEILDEADYDKYLAMPDAPDDVMAWRFGFRHFCHDFHHIFPFMYGAVDWGYQGVVRACRGWSNFINVDDAVQMKGDGEIAGLGNTVWHCGKIDVGREEAAAFKEMSFQGLYPPPFPDPLVVKAYQEGRLSYEGVFAEAYRQGLVRDFSGPYPRYVKEYARMLGCVI